MHSISKNIIVALLAALLFLPLSSGRAQDISMPDIDALIEQYLKGFAAQLPKDQKGQIDTYRKYIKDSINSILPPGVLEEELRAIQEAFPGDETASGREAPVTQSTTDQALLLNADPQSPFPKTRVTVSADFNVAGGFQFPDLEKGASTNYQWFLDNKAMPAFSGVGQNTLSFTSGVLGTIHSVRMQARLAGGRIIQAALLIPVVDADIVWYTDSYTPPGYRGKALPTLQGSIVVSAQPFVPPAFGLLDYTWTIDDDTPLDALGIGKNQALIGFPFSSHTVSVHITDLAGNIDIFKEIVIERARPQVVFHQIRTGKYDRDDAGRGSFQAAPAGKFSAVAVPYYFNVQTLRGLRFTWLFDENTLPEAARNPDVFTLNIGQAKLKAGTQIEKSLQLTVENKNPKRTESGEFSVPITIR
ncbi:MAG: hypothetical protein Q7S09_05735 [bacterium]|nr:hypothetical protein [bacterium]